MKPYTYEQLRELIKKRNRLRKGLAFLKKNNKRDPNAEAELKAILNQDLKRLERKLIPSLTDRIGAGERPWKGSC